MQILRDDRKIVWLDQFWCRSAPLNRSETRSERFCRCSLEFGEASFLGIKYKLVDCIEGEVAFRFRFYAICVLIRHSRTMCVLWWFTTSYYLIVAYANNQQSRGNNRNGLTVHEAMRNVHIDIPMLKQVYTSSS